VFCDVAYIIYAATVWTAVFLFVGRRLAYMWKPGIIGVGLMMLVDYFGTEYNFYKYLEGIFYLGKLPVFHIIGTYAVSILYFNWLPPRWSGRALYIIYVSTLLLGLEAYMHFTGALVYPQWKLWYSYFLVASGLVLITYLSDKLGLLNKITALPAVPSCRRRNPEARISKRGP